MFTIIQWRLLGNEVICCYFCNSDFPLNFCGSHLSRSLSDEITPIFQNVWKHGRAWVTNLFLHIPPYIRINVIFLCVQFSINWLICICCGYNFMILWGLIELVSLSQNIYPKPTFLCWHWGWSLPGYSSSSVVLLHPKLSRGKHYHDSLLHKGYTAPNVKSQVFNTNHACCDQVLNPGGRCARRMC